MRGGMFCGVGCALVTPFCGGAVDYPAFDALVGRQLDAGADALIVCGTTGEPAALTQAETDELIARAVCQAEGRVSVIAGAGAIDTLSAECKARRAREMGADAVLCVTPYYVKPDQRGLIEHFERVADAAQIPVILYNVPGRTGVNLEPDTVLALAKHPLIRGVKEASADIGQAAELIRVAGEGISVYCGNDAMALSMLALGARGVISVAANIALERVKAITDAYFEGDIRAAQRAQLSLLPLIRALFTTSNPMPVKAALNALGLIEDQLRAPLTPLGNYERARLIREMRALGIISEGYTHEQTDGLGNPEQDAFQ